MWFYFAIIILASAYGLVAFLIITTKDYKKFKRDFLGNKPRNVLPVITPGGELVSSMEDLDEQIDSTLTQYDCKKSDLKILQSKLDLAEENLLKLNVSAVGIKKQAAKLRANLVSNEKESEDLKKEWMELKKLQIELIRDNKENAAGRGSCEGAKKDLESVKKNRGKDLKNVGRSASCLLRN